MIPATLRPEPRCHVCRTDSIREHVNAMLAGGSSYAQIVRAVAADGAGELSLDSVRNHANRHFPVQNAAQATFREIVERRAAQNRIDFINGVTTAITPLAFYETLMVKAFQRLVQDNTKVSIETGLRAAEKLQGALGEGDLGADLMRLRVQVGRMIDAVHATVPESMWSEIAARLDDAQLVQPSREPLYPGDVGDDDDDEPFDAGDVGDDDDDEPLDAGGVGDDDDDEPFDAGGVGDDDDDEPFDAGGVGDDDDDERFDPGEVGGDDDF